MRAIPKSSPLIAAAFLIAGFTAGAANAATGFTTQRVNMYAGPGNNYPRIERIGNRSQIYVHGCIRDYDWCDVTFRDARGWVEGDSIVIAQGRRRLVMRDYGPRYDLPILSFSFGSYWDDNYQGRHFYRERDRYRPRDDDRDGVPNARDRDRDGDGIPNRVDRRPDNPRDGRRSATQRDEDRDGIPNARDKDRDGDGVTNRRDNQPDNPRR